MKTHCFLRVGKATVLVSAILTGILFGCEDYGDYLDSYTKEGFSNKDDQTTTDIAVSIPRIEINGNTGKVYISVTDQDGKALQEFNEYNFVVKQVCKGSTDTTTIKAESFSSLNKEGKNIAAAATMDYSGSMTSNDIVSMQDALVAFINAKSANDYLEIIKFSDASSVIQTFTNDVSSLVTAANSSYASGFTAFYDAVYTGLNDGKTFSNNHSDHLPAVLAFTDGYENNSSVTLDQILSLAKQNQIPIYTIGYGSPDQTTMERIASETGGRYMYTPVAADLISLYSTISGQLKNIYEYTWTIDKTSCAEVIVVVEATYKGGKGTFTTRATKSYFP